MRKPRGKNERPRRSGVRALGIMGLSFPIGFALVVSGCSVESDKGTTTSRPGRYRSKAPWQQVAVDLPDGSGRVTFQRQRAHEFLAEYDRKVVVENAQGVFRVFELPANTGGRTNVRVYLLRGEEGSEIWLEEGKELRSAYVVDPRKLSCVIVGEMEHWTPDADASARAVPGGMPLKLPSGLVLLGTIRSREGRLRLVKPK